MSKKFKVQLWEEIGGYAFIEAKTAKEAREKAEALLEDEGTEGFDNKENIFETTHRETDVLDVEEIEEE